MEDTKKDHREEEKEDSGSEKKEKPKRRNLQTQHPKKLMPFIAQHVMPKKRKKKQPSYSETCQKETTRQETGRKIKKMTNKKKATRIR